jgi:hypothetical protein
MTPSIGGQRCPRVDVERLLVGQCADVASRSCEVLSPARSATCPILSSGSLVVAIARPADRLHAHARRHDARLARIDALAADGLLDRTATEAGLRVRLRDIEQRTRALVAAESACCAFLDFDLARENGDQVLDVTGPADARPVIEMFFAP